MNPDVTTSSKADTENAPIGLAAKQPSRAQRKLLAIDGGGIRGGICIEMLAEIERLVREEIGQPHLVLADYFDFIGGTSVGAILAACLSMGMSTSQLRDYTASGVAQFFRPTRFWNRHRFKYTADGLKAGLQEIFGEETLGSQQLRTYLMIIMRNATTDSPWPVTNNPQAMYNNPELVDCNLRLPLWQLLRASAAAPTFFPPEEIRLGEKTLCFVDGAITIANNPAHQLFLQATLPSYKLCWPTGEDKMLLVSVGTGRIPLRNAASADMLTNAFSLIGCLLSAASTEQDLLCRLFGKCVVGDEIDSEIGDLIAAETPWPKQFTYCRYDLELSTPAFRAMGCDVDPLCLHTLDDVPRFADALAVGRAFAKAMIRREHFQGFL